MHLYIERKDDKRMNKLFGILHYLGNVFSWIVTGVTCVTAIYIIVFWGTDVKLGVEILWQILLVSAICALESLLLYNEKREFSKKEMLIRCFLTFAFVDITVLTFGFYFHWFHFSNWKMVLGMELCIVAVFAAIIGVSSLAGQKEADTMNKKLKERDVK